MPGVYYFSPKLHEVISLNFEVTLNENPNVEIIKNNISTKLDKKIDSMMKSQRKLSEQLEKDGSVVKGSDKKIRQDAIKDDGHLFKSVEFE